MSSQGWIWAVLHWLVSAGVFVALLRTVLAWRMEVFGRAIDARRPGYPELNYYTFAVRNAEDRPLTAPFSIEVALEKVGTDFKQGPRLYCGLRTRVAASRIEWWEDPRNPESSGNRIEGSSHAVYRVDVERMRARESWIIWFMSDATAAHVALRVRPREPFAGAETPLPLIEPMELRLTQRSALRTSVDVKQAAVLTAILCVLLYVYPILNRQATLFGIGEVMREITWVDAIVVAGFLVIGFVFYRASVSRMQLPFVQGYRYFVDREGRDKRTVGHRDP